jgi:hypothetical protein
MTKLLIGWGADPRIKNQDGQTPADTAQAAGNQFPSRSKQYAEIGSLLASATAKPLNKEEKAALIEQVKLGTNSESGISESDKMLSECKTTTSADTFYRVAAMLIQAKDARVIEVIGDRTNDFKEFDQITGDWFYKTLYEFNIPETRALAKQGLVIPPAEAPYLKAFLAKQNATVPPNERWRSKGEAVQEVYRRFWAGLILLKGNSEEQNLAVKGLSSLFGDLGLGPTRNATTNSVRSLHYQGIQNLTFKVQELLHSKCNAARPLALVFLGPLSGPYAGINLEVIRVMFNGGCPEALGALTTALRSNPSEENTGSDRVVGADVVLDLLGSQNTVPERYIYPDWAPPGFAYSDKEPQPSKKLKREQVACWLEKKFQEIKAGKSDPLSTWDSFRGSGIQ